MTVLDSQKIQETDARASSLMKEGIGLLYSSNDAEAALVCFDRALELRLRLPPAKKLLHLRLHASSIFRLRECFGATSDFIIFLPAACQFSFVWPHPS